MGGDGVVEMATNGAVGKWKRRHFAGAQSPELVKVGAEGRRRKRAKGLGLRGGTCLRHK